MATAALSGVFPPEPYENQSLIYWKTSPNLG